jgi:hypothetical protein
MTCHRRYYFELPGEWTSGGHDKLLEFLQHRCESKWWFNEPLVEGAPFDRLAFSYTVSGRDQWFTHKRAMNLAVDCMYVIGMREHHTPEPIWETLGPDGLRWRIPVDAEEASTEADASS